MAFFWGSQVATETEENQYCKCKYENACKKVFFEHNFFLISTPLQVRKKYFMMEYWIDWHAFRDFYLWKSSGIELRCGTNLQPAEAFWKITPWRANRKRPQSQGCLGKLRTHCCWTEARNCWYVRWKVLSGSFHFSLGRFYSLCCGSVCCVEEIWNRSCPALSNNCPLAKRRLRNSLVGLLNSIIAPIS